MNQQIQNIVDEIKRIRVEWDEWNVDGYDMLAAMTSLDTELQYMNAPYWGVLSQSVAVQKQVNQKIIHQCVHSLVDLTNMVHTHLALLLKRLGEICQQCEQYKTKVITDLMLNDEVNPKRKKQDLSSLTIQCDKMIEVVKEVRNAFANDWNMKAMMLNDLNNLLLKEQIVFSTASSEEEEVPPNESQQKLIFYAQSWKLKPYLSEQCFDRYLVKLSSIGLTTSADKFLPVN